MPIPPIARRAAVLASVAALAAGLGACGGGGKPDYCKDKDTLQSTLEGLSSVDVRSNGVSALQTQLGKVKTDTQALVASAKSDFPTETSAMSTALDKLSSSVSGVSSSPSTGDVVTIATAVASFASAVQSFGKAAADKC